MRTTTMFSLAVLLFSGCSNQKDIPRNSDSVPLRCTIILGSGGGFTGMYEGYVIDSLGEVSSWRGRVFEGSERTPVGTLDAEKLRKIQNLIAESKIEETDFRERGNITSFITLLSPRTTHRISWSGPQPGDGVPPNVKDFYSAVTAYVDSAVHSR